MSIDRAVLGFAGFMTVLSAVLVWLFSPWWLLLTAFVGLNLIQSAMSDWCLMSNLIALLFPTLRGANDR